MRKHLARRLAVVASTHALEGEPFYLRMVTVMHPDLPEADQDRWLQLAERAVDDDLQRTGIRHVLLWSHVHEPGLVFVDSPQGRYRVAIDNDATIPKARIVERTERRW